ncbi:hypothetical protein SENE111051_19035 [Serratia nematodiphila]
MIEKAIQITQRHDTQTPKKKVLYIEIIFKFKIKNYKKT